MNLTKLISDIHETKVKNWGKTDVNDNRTFGDHVALMHSELSEALEEYRKGMPVNKIYYHMEKPEGIPIELADVIIRILSYCADHEIPIEDALEIKLEFNRGRPFRHGGKKL